MTTKHFVDKAKSAVKRIDSHTYQLPSYEVTDTGLNILGIINIPFVKGSRNSTELHGMITMDVLAMLIDHLSQFQDGPLANEETADAIEYLEKALYRLGDRQADRHNRNVNETYNK